MDVGHFEGASHFVEAAAILVGVDWAQHWIHYRALNTY